MIEVRHYLRIAFLFFVGLLSYSVSSSASKEGRNYDMSKGRDNVNEIDPVLLYHSPQDNKVQVTPLPTDQEINAINARLPMSVADGVIFMKVDYNKSTKTQAFVFRSSNKTSEATAKQIKTALISNMRNDPVGKIRMNAGVTYVYLYYYLDGTLINSIKINKSDF